MTNRINKVIELWDEGQPVYHEHPEELSYEAGLEGLLLFLVLISLVYMGFLKRPGFITGIFIAGYGSSRFFVEYFNLFYGI